MQLPPHVRVSHGRAYYVRKIAGKARWTPLCRATDGEAAIRAAYEAACDEKPRTLSDVMALWLRAPDGLVGLRESTQRDYRRHIEKRLSPVFGSMLPWAVTPGHIARYLDARPGPTGNREVATLATVFQWAMRKGHAPANPCRGVRRNTEKPRTRYVEDGELASALEKATPAFRRLMLAACLTGLRQGDLRALRKAQVTEDGLLLEESKRGKRVLISWSPELRSLVDDALATSRCDRVFTNRSGMAWTSSATDSALRRLEAPFTFHDLRAKAESDHEYGLGLLTRYKRARRLTPVRLGKGLGG